MIEYHCAHVVHSAQGSLDTLLDNNYRLLDLTVYGRQETWEDSPRGWPQREIMDILRTDGRPIAQWARLKAGHSDDLGTGRR